MGKIKIIYDKSKCIGAGECENLSKELWKVNNGMATLKGAVLKEGKYELVLDDSEFKKQEAVAKSCPVLAIKVMKL